jgi:hypothetical protein
MRDYRAHALALQVRLRPARRAVPDVARVHLAPRDRVAPTTQVAVSRWAPVTIAVSFSATRAHTVNSQFHQHRQHATTVTTVHHAAVRTSRTVLERTRQWAEGRHTTSPRTEREVVSVRREARVPGVERVVPRSAPTPPPESSSLPAVTESARPFPGRPVVGERPTTGPSPAELATITDHVLSAIDHRLIAYNERLGRG